MAQGRGFWAGDRSIFPVRTLKGYLWKLCPFSTAYRSRFYDRGFAGNTTNPDITQETFSSVVTADHPYTEGGMNYRNPGGTPGWSCLDDACPYFIDNTIRYFEF